MFMSIIRAITQQPSTGNFGDVTTAAVEPIHDIRSYTDDVGNVVTLDLVQSALGLSDVDLAEFDRFSQKSLREIARLHRLEAQSKKSSLQARRIHLLSESRQQNKRRTRIRFPHGTSVNPARVRIGFGPFGFGWCDSFQLGSLSRPPQSPTDLPGRSLGLAEFVKVGERVACEGKTVASGDDPSIDPESIGNTVDRGQSSAVAIDFVRCRVQSSGDTQSYKVPGTPYSILDWHRSRR